jgi:hypothetical protein
MLICFLKMDYEGDAFVLEGDIENNSVRGRFSGVFLAVICFFLVFL